MKKRPEAGQRWDGERLRGSRHCSYKGWNWSTKCVCICGYVCVREWEAEEMG